MVPRFQFPETIHVKRDMLVRLPVDPHLELIPANRRIPSQWVLNSGLCSRAYGLYAFRANEAAPN